MSASQFIFTFLGVVVGLILLYIFGMLWGKRKELLSRWTRNRDFKKSAHPRGRMRFSRMWMGDTEILVSESESFTVKSKKSSSSKDRETPPKDERIDINPVEVVSLLETDVEIPLDDLEDKLDKLKERALFYTTTLYQAVPGDIGHAITLLEARRRYKKLKAHIPWRTTTREKINVLCNKYRLEHHNLDRYMPELPQYVIEEIERFKGVFRKAVKKVRHENPDMILSLIAKPELFSSRPIGDPILLAKSPFGDFYYVLCAWDEEVNFVEDLLGGDMVHPIREISEDEESFG